MVAMVAMECFGLQTPVKQIVFLHRNYHLVMTNIAMENPKNKWRLMSLGKSSISMGHLFHGYVKQPEGKSPQNLGMVQ